MIDIVSIISIPLSVIALIISIWEYRLRKKTTLLRPHSDRLAKRIEEWLNHDFNLKIYRLNYVSEDYTLYGEELTPIYITHKIRGLENIFQHLKSGYKNIWEEYNKLKNNVERHNSEVYTLLNKIYKKMRYELKLSTSPNNSTKHAKYIEMLRIIMLKIIQKHSKELEIEELKTNRGTIYRLTFNDEILVIGDREDCEKARLLITNIWYDKYIIGKVTNLHKEVSKLEERLKNLKEKMRLNIVDYIELGGIIKGVCEVCKD